MKGLALPHTGLAIIGLGVLLLGMFPQSASAQGFMAKPMRVDLSPRPGETITTAVEVTNSLNFPVTVQAGLAMLGQTDVGGGMAIDPLNTQSPAALRTCYPWLTLDQSELTVPPRGSGAFTLILRAPYNTRGFYGAMLTLQNKEPEARDKKIALVVKFLVPILVVMQGAPAREKIELTDIAMNAVTEQEGAASSTIVQMQTRNNGETFARVQGRVTVAYQVGTKWRQVIDATLTESALLPGYTINLQENIARSLPSGRYKLQATLYVSGRFRGHLEREIDFVGDSHVTSVAFDVQPIFQPTELMLTSVPGSLRSAVINILNPTEEAVKVTCSLVTPRQLLGISMGQVRGDDYSCSDWSELSTQAFTLLPNRRQAVRVTVKQPANAEQKNYYADLVFQLRHEDGQNAGTFTVPVWVQTSKTPSAPQAVAGTMNLSILEENKYAVIVKMINTGDVHLMPSATMALLSSARAEEWKCDLETTTKRLLPISSATFSGVADFSRVSAGNYSLLISMRYTDKMINTVYPITVMVNGDVRTVTLVEVPKEAVPADAR